MDFSHNEENTTKRLTGIVVVVAFHVLMGFLVVSGMGKRLVEKIKNPVETKIIEEVKPPPPQDLPPPPPPPEIKTPPPPFIPPPEVVVQAPAQQNNPIAAATNVAPPAPTAVRPQAPAASAPVGEAPKPAPPAKTPAYLNVNDCTKPEYPKNSARNEEEGTVIIAFLVGADGRVKDSRIEKSSGFRDLDKAAVAGLTACPKFRAGTENGKPVEAWARVAYEWKIE